MRRVALDPELLAAGVLGRQRPRHLLGLLAYGRWAQYVELLGPAESALLQEELQSGGRIGALSIDALIEQAQDRRALLADRLPYGAPDDLVLVLSTRIIETVVDRVQVARCHEPRAREQTDLGERARHIINFLAVGIVGDIVRERSPTESLRDHLVHVAAVASAPLVSDDDQLSPRERTVWRHVDPLTGNAAFSVTFRTFIETQIDISPFSLDAVPDDLLDLGISLAS